MVLLANRAGPARRNTPLGRLTLAAESNTLAGTKAELREAMHRQPRPRFFLANAMAVLTIAGTLAACSATVQVKKPDPRPENWDVRIVGDRIEIKDTIHFAFDSDEILPESHHVLDKIVEILKQHVEIKALRIHGHTDAHGNEAFNEQLSERRAYAVTAYLRERGIEQELLPAGFGKTQPLCNEDTDACHAKNRRVEFYILDAADAQMPNTEFEPPVPLEDAPGAGAK